MKSPTHWPPSFPPKKNNVMATSPTPADYGLGDTYSAEIFTTPRHSELSSTHHRSGMPFNGWPVMPRTTERTILRPSEKVTNHCQARHFPLLPRNDQEMSGRYSRNHGWSMESSKSSGVHSQPAGKGSGEHQNLAYAHSPVPNTSARTNKCRLGKR